MKLRLCAVALLLCLVPASAANTETRTAPVDQSARDKFPNATPELVDMFAAINRVVNENITYEDDQEHYGVDEKWVTLPSDGKGDCEDFALSKMEIARKSGFEVLAFARIRTLFVDNGMDKGGHAILEVLLDDGSIMFLDNRFSEPMTRGELEKAGYHFFDW